MENWKERLLTLLKMYCSHTEQLVPPSIRFQGDHYTVATCLPDVISRRPAMTGATDTLRVLQEIATNTKGIAYQIIPREEIGIQQITESNVLLKESIQLLKQAVEKEIDPYWSVDFIQKVHNFLDKTRTPYTKQVL